MFLLADHGFYLFINVVPNEGQRDNGSLDLSFSQMLLNLKKHCSWFLAAESQSKSPNNSTVLPALDLMLSHNQVG